MMHYADPTMPRYQLPFEQLPRGFVPWPEVVVKALEQQEAKSHFGRYADEYRLDSLTRRTLRYYYEDFDVAYRLTEGGVEVLGVGWDEVVKYLKDPTVKVVVA